MPFILFSIMPLIIIQYLGYVDLYLYSLSFANAILSSDDLLNIILQLFVKPNEKGFKRLYVIPNNYDYLIEVSDNLEVDFKEEKLPESIVESDIGIIINDNNDNVVGEKETIMDTTYNELVDVNENDNKESIDNTLKEEIKDLDVTEIDNKDISIEVNNLQTDNTAEINDLQINNIDNDDNSTNINDVDLDPSNNSI